MWFACHPSVTTERLVTAEVHLFQQRTSIASWPGLQSSLDIHIVSAESVTVECMATRSGHGGVVTAVTVQ